MKEVLKIGIIDDDESKITSIINRLCIQPDTTQVEKKSFFDKYDFEPVILEITEDKMDIVIQIQEQNIDCVIIDYKLNSCSTVDYDGTKLASFIDSKIVEFPIFLLTSFEDDLFEKTTFNSYQVFDFERYYNEEKETIELNYKMIHQIRNYRLKIDEWKKQLIELIPRAGESAKVDDNIMELNHKIMSSLSPESLLTKKTEKILTSEKMDEFLEKIDEILERL